MNKKNVLVFPAGAENALEIYESLRYNVNIEVFGASGKKDCARFIYDGDHYIEADLYINKVAFIETINEIVSKYSIDVIIPTHDDVALFLAKKREAIDCKILVADYYTAEICRHKRLTFNLFCDESFCPRVYENKDEIDDKEYPVFVKPNISQGAVGARAIETSEQLSTVDEDDIICEFLPGKEYTVDCFTNRNGELVFIGARTRDRIVMGIAFGSTSVETSGEIKEIARIINSRLSFFGAWFFQLRESCTGELKLLEISCRQSGTMTLYRHMGINFPLLGIFELFDVDTSYILLDGKWEVERCLKSKFKNEIVFQTVYIDYDDTLITNKQVNLNMICFLYKCINDHKRIVLITRHEGDLLADMKAHKLFPDLFDEIISLKYDQEKCDFINSQDAVLVDNSFEERKKVFDKFQIPVFDVDMIDSFC